MSVRLVAFSHRGCVCVFLAVWQACLLTYRVYSTAVINVFIMISTWLTVAMSLERYLAICHPLRQDLYLTTRRIKIVIVLTYILSFIFNIPVLWRYEVQDICPRAPSAAQPSRAEVANGDGLGAGQPATFEDVAGDLGAPWNSSLRNVSVGGEGAANVTGLLAGLALSLNSTASDPGAMDAGAWSSAAFRPNPVDLWQSRQLDTVYRILWAVVNNVVPLLLLVYFNVCLCRKIYRSYKMRQKFKQEHHSGHENSSHVLTITLVVIVLMFFILVAPSEFVIHAANLTNTNNTYTSMSVEAVMNFMQSLNFSVNFILYCIISPYFRKTLKYIFCCGCYNIYQVSKQWKKEFETSLM